MAFNFRRQHLIERLGIEQLPALAEVPESSTRMENGFEIPIHSATCRGQKCPTCAANGQSSFVFSGSHCRFCDTKVEQRNFQQPGKVLAEKDIPIRTATLPARKCPTCAGNGQTSWVIPGKQCPQCYSMVD